MTERIAQSPSAYLHNSAAWLVGIFAVVALLLGVVGFTVLSPIWSARGLAKSAYARRSARDLRQCIGSSSVRPGV
jgi:hypothetical protein